MLHECSISPREDGVCQLRSLRDDRDVSRCVLPIVTGSNAFSLRLTLFNVRTGMMMMMSELVVSDEKQ